MRHIPELGGIGFSGLGVESLRVPPSISVGALARLFGLWVWGSVKGLCHPPAPASPITSEWGELVEEPACFGFQPLGFTVKGLGVCGFRVLG